jgi:carboxymethylenebutenolidase
VLKTSVKIDSSEGAQFDCYLAIPQSRKPVPAIVLASAILGVDGDIRAIADDFASRGYLAAAPDLFWRTVPGPLARGDPRAAPRGQPRIETIRTGERDLADALLMLRRQPLFNGRAVVMGLCYGGPYAILGPYRLGYDAGIACHGSQMLDFLAEFEQVTQPLCILWGDLDHAAPANVRDTYAATCARMSNATLRVLAGVQHGYMLRGNAKAFDPASYELSMQLACEMLARNETAPRGN